MEAKIDVILPVYNVENYLSKCLDSLLGQTIPVKIIAVDDGSTDNSFKILSKYKKKNSNFIKIIRTKNKGLSAARNEGLRYANKKYVSFMDSDDWVELNYYEKLLNKIEAEKASLICSNINYYYNLNNIKTKKPHYYNKEKILNTCNKKYFEEILYIFPMMQNKLWLNDKIFKNFFFLEGCIYEDLDFFYRIYPFLKKIVFNYDSNFFYRQRPNSLVKKHHSTKDIIKIFENIKKFYLKNNLYEQYKDEIDYLTIRNILFSSIKRISYSKDFRFIYENMSYFYNYINDNLNNWKRNNYLMIKNSKNIILKSYNKFTILIYTLIIYIYSLFVSLFKIY